jgi:hypothetical protein
VHSNGNLAWKRVEALLKHLGATVYEGSSSTVTFVLNDRKLTVDGPHPRKECGKGLVKRVKMYLEELGTLERLGKGERSDDRVQRIYRRDRV